MDVSANGQGTVSNMWIVDGLDATSAIRQGVVNLTPNPDVVQEATTEVNTFNVEYGRASSIQFAMTTKSGADQFHGLASDYFNYQSMYAKYSLPGSDHKYSPFHSNNFSANIGGPIIPHHQFFFFFGVEPLRSSAATGNQSITFPDAAFASFASTNFPNTFGTKILNTYTPSGATISGVAKTATRYFPERHLRNRGDQQSALRHADDRQRRLQFHELPEWRPILRPRRQILQERPHLRQFLPHDPAQRRRAADPAVQHHQPYRTARLSGELDTHVQPDHVQRSRLCAEPHRRLPRRDRRLHHSQHQRDRPVGRLRRRLRAG